MAFCTHCGARLEDGAAFCVKCGAPVERPDATRQMPAAAPSATAPLPATSSPATAPLPAASRYEAPSRASAPASAGPSSGERRQSSIIIACTAIVVVCLGAVVFLFHPWTTGTSTSTSSSSPTSSAVSVAAPSTSAPTSSAQTTPAAQGTSTAKLTEAYENIGTLDSEVRQAATDFNNTYTKDDYSARQSCYSEAIRIQTQVAGQMTTLKGYSESDAAGSQKLSNLIQLTSDLQHRIDVIVSAWKIDLGYSTPSDHTDEITAPLSADNVNGVNSYKSDFDSLYPNARP